MGKKIHQSVDNDLREYVKIKPSYPSLDDVISDVNSISEQLTETVKVVNVKKFGAKGDGITDDTLAIQEAIDYIRNNPIVVGSYTVYKKLVFEFGVYLVTDSLNFTGIRSKFIIDLDGSIIIGKFTDYPIFDFTDSRYYHLTNGSIYGDTTTTPSVGILQARRTDNRVASDNFLSNVTVSGNYTITAIANISSEMSNYDNCRFENNYVGGSSVTTVFFGNQNKYNIASKYQTLTVDVVSAIMHTFRRISIYRRGSTGGCAVELSGIHQMDWLDSTYVMCDSGLAGVKLAYVSNSNLEWHQEREGVGASYLCYVDGTSGQHSDLRLVCSGFISDTSTTGVLFNECSIIKDSYVKTSKLKIQHSTTASYLYNNTFISRDSNGMIDLSGAKYFRGHIETEKISNITWLGANKQDFFGDVLVAGNYFEPKFIYTATVTNNVLSAPKKYSQVYTNNSIINTIEIGDVHADGSEIYLRAYNGYVVTLKHNVGNIYTKDGLDYNLTHIAYTKLIYDGTLGKWLMEK